MTRIVTPRSRSCRFCRQHELEGCDWGLYSPAHRKECNACSDYRALNDDVDHVCLVPHREFRAFRKYSRHDPHNFPQHFVCTRCFAAGIPFCDVDPYLNLGCSSCQGRVHGVRKDSCKIAFHRDVDGQIACNPSGEALAPELALRPVLVQGNRKWFRRRCDTCVAAKTACSWLDNRSEWSNGCSSCRDRDLACFDSGVLVERPSNPIDGSSLTWSITREKRPGWAELSQSTPWRKGCGVCLLAGSHCRVLARLPDYACKKCSQLGLECTEWLDQQPGDDTQNASARPVPRTFPLFDLSRVGFGGFMPFDACESCIKKERNCDQQRPCDSCIKHQDGCDRLAPTKAHMKNCFKGRLDPPPGPLYYLGLGYGPGGVDDVKDGSRIEDWIGPPAPAYGRLHVKSHQSEEEGGRRLRNELRPPTDPPPHGAANGVLEGVPTADLTAARLRELMLLAWPNAYPLNEHPEFDFVMSRWRQRLEDEPKELRRQFPRPRRHASPSSTAQPCVDLTADDVELVYTVNDNDEDADLDLGPIQDFNAT